jgi:hypothetical protein
MGLALAPPDQLLLLMPPEPDGGYGIGNHPNLDLYPHLALLLRPLLLRLVVPGLLQALRDRPYIP